MVRYRFIRLLRLLGVDQRVDDPGFGKAFATEQTGITGSAGTAVGQGVVATVRKREIDLEAFSQGDDACFGEIKQRCVNPEASLAFHTCRCGEARRFFEGTHEFRAAIRVARIVDGIDAEEDIKGPQDFGPAEGTAKEDGVTRRDVGDRDATGNFVDAGMFGDIDFVGEGGTTEGAQVEPERDVAHRVKGLGNARSCFDFLLMALAVIKGKGVAFKALLACNG